MEKWEEEAEDLGRDAYTANKWSKPKIPNPYKKGSKEAEAFWEGWSKEQGH